MKRKPPTTASPQSTQRCGAVLVAVIVVLAVASTILFYMMKAAIDQHRQLRSHRHEVQADWLARAGIDRAVAQLRQSADYTGETWHVPADQLDGISAAEVEIKIEPAAETESRQITARADYPAGTLHRSRKTQQTIVQLP
jgi:type II secretory pathway component PulK